MEYSIDVELPESRRVMLENFKQSSGYYQGIQEQLNESSIHGTQRKEKVGGSHATGR